MGKTTNSSENSTPNSKKSKSYRRNMMFRAKSSSNKFKHRLRLNQQINKLKRLLGKQEELQKEFLQAKLPSDASELQTDIQDVTWHIKLVSSEVLQLQAKADSPELPYIHTPINHHGPIKLPRIPKLDEDKLNTITTTLNNPEWKRNTITTSDLELLKEYNLKQGTLLDYWLKDNVIMEYLTLLGQNSSDVFILDSQIASKIATNQRLLDKKPATYYRKKKLLEYKKLIFPVNSHHHWTLVVWHGVHKTLTYYDSLNTPSSELLKPFKLFLNERLTLEGAPQNSLTGLREITDALPYALKQRNAVDCGIYLLMITRSLIQGFPFAFDQSQMNFLRQVILYELIVNHLLPF